MEWFKRLFKCKPPVLKSWPALPIATKLCPLCGKKAVLRYGGYSTFNERIKEFWCGCGHREYAGTEKCIIEDPEVRERWEAANRTV